MLNLSANISLLFTESPFLERFAKASKNNFKAVAVSNLPFLSYETARIADSQDKFARRIFLTSPWEPRTRLNLEEYRLSRAYFFGVFIRLGKSGKDTTFSGKSGNAVGLIAGPAPQIPVNVEH